MPTLLEWDTAFFGRTMGSLAWPEGTEAQLEAELRAARQQGFRYLLAQVDPLHSDRVALLEQNGFRLADIGATWQGPIPEARNDGVPGSGPPVAVASEEDIPGLERLAEKLFPLSRFYCDPFFTRDEADRFHRAWVANSVRGQAAHRVFHVDSKGFVTCRKTGAETGNIPLIGVAISSRGEGVGRSLMRAAMDYFREEGVKQMTVKTQLKNLAAMNFYRSLGLSLGSASLTYRLIVD